MPRMIRWPLFLSLFLFLSFPAWAEMNEKQALELVKNHACTDGGTLDSYFEKKGDKGVVLDLGWKVHPRSNGAFEVERLMLQKEKSSTSYKWVVDREGNIKPVNGKALGVTR